MGGSSFRYALFFRWVWFSLCVYTQVVLRKGDAAVTEWIIHLNTWFSSYTRGADEIRADIFFSSSG